MPRELGQFTASHELAQAFMTYRMWMQALVADGVPIKGIEQEHIRSIAAIFDDYPLNSYFPSHREKRLLARLGKQLRLYTNLRCNMLTDRTGALSDPFDPVAVRIKTHSVYAPTTGCLLWTGAVAGGNYRYPVIKIRNKQQAVRRVVWENTYGPIPEGQRVTTICKDEKCIEHSHLVLMFKGVFISGDSYRASLEQARLDHEKLSTWEEKADRIDTTVLTASEEFAIKQGAIPPEELLQKQLALSKLRSVKVCRSKDCYETLSGKSRFIYCLRCRRKRQGDDVDGAESRIASNDIANMLDDAYATDQDTGDDDWDDAANNVIDLDAMTASPPIPALSPDNPELSLNDWLTDQIKPPPYAHDERTPRGETGAWQGVSVRIDADDDHDTDDQEDDD